VELVGGVELDEPDVEPAGVVEAAGVLAVIAAANAVAESFNFLARAETSAGFTLL
jgi:hypothetical protein